MKRKLTARRVALYGVLTGLALVLGYLESLIPAFFAVPGMKLGLTNLVVLCALYLLGWPDALAVNLVRILLAGLLFGNGMSLAYSLAGGALSALVMILLKQTGRFRPVAVSVAGGIAHNVGQILCAMVLLETGALLWYLAVLWLTGLAAGAVIGGIGGLLIRRLEPVMSRRDGA